MQHDNVVLLHPRPDIRIPHERFMQVSPETRARLTRHYCRTAGTTAMLNAFAEIPAPSRFWRKALSGTVIFVCGVAMATLIVVGW